MNTQTSKEQTADVVIAVDLSDKGHKSYIGFKDVNQLTEYWNDEEKSPHLYEVAQGLSNRKI